MSERETGGEELRVERCAKAVEAAAVADAGSRDHLSNRRASHSCWDKAEGEAESG